MTLQGDVKFKGKLTPSFKNDKKNLANFHASGRKSENLHFDGLLLPKDIKFQMKKYKRVVSYDTDE